MNQKIFNNILLVIIVIILLKQFTPNKDSTMFILKKYYNYIIDKIKQLLGKLGLYKYVENFSFLGRTFPGIPNFNSRTPILNDNYAKFFIKSYNKMNPNVSIEEIQNMYNFIESIVSIDMDNYFLTPSDTNKILFTNDEKEKIKTILLSKLNAGIYSFSNIEFLNDIIYYNNFSGKDVEPFIFNVDCDNNFNNLQIYIEISIRNDIKRNVEILVVNKIKLIINNDDIVNNLGDKYKDKNLMDDIFIDYNDKIFERTNMIDDFLINNNKSNQLDINDNIDFTEFSQQPKNVNINYEVNHYESNNNDYSEIDSVFNNQKITNLE